MKENAIIVFHTGQKFHLKLYCVLHSYAVEVHSRQTHTHKLKTNNNKLFPDALQLSNKPIWKSVQQRVRGEQNKQNMERPLALNLMYMAGRISDTILNYVVVYRLSMKQTNFQHHKTQTSVRKWREMKQQNCMIHETKRAASSNTPPS